MLLVQLPPALPRDDARLAHFLRQVPAWIRVAVELRHPYSDADLTWWADRIREWDQAGQDVLVYFNNDGDANAVRNARTLQAVLGIADGG